MRLSPLRSAPATYQGDQRKPGAIPANRTPTIYLFARQFTKLAPALFFITFSARIGFENIASASLTQEQVASQKVVAQLPDLVEAQVDLVYATLDERELHLDVFRRKDQKAAQPAVVLIHGGGWMNGNKERFHALAHAFALRGYVAVAIEYRLGGESRYPAAVVDCMSAMNWIVAHAEQLNIDATQLFAIGGSAGGHLVGLLAAANRLAEFQPANARSAPQWKLKAALVMAGPMDLTTGPIATRSREQPDDAPTNRWMGASIDDAPELYRQASPITHFTPETSPIFFFTGELDRLVQNGPARARLRELGVPTGVQIYHLGPHGCWNEHPWFDAMVNDMDRCMRTYVEGESLQVSWPIRGWRQGSLMQSADALVWEIEKPQEQTLEFPRLYNPVISMNLVGHEDVQLRLQPEIDAWTFQLPNKFSAESLQLRVETIGMPRFPDLPVISSESDGRITLPAHLADVHGKLLRYEPQPHKNTVGYWANADDWCSWRFYLDQPGTFEIRIWQGCGTDQGGSIVRAVVDDTSVPFEVVDTGHFQNFLERSIGKIKVDSAGTHDFELRVERKAANAVMDVRQVQLERVPN